MTTANKLIKSLVGYVNDVKPYRSKLREFTSELFFEDDVNAAVIDQQPELQVGFRNVWGRLDDERLARLSEGQPADRIINIPATVLSRFSLNTFMNYGQSPLGHDPASPDLTNQNTDGKPDSEVPYSLPNDPEGWDHFSQSHQIGVQDAIPIPIVVTSPEFVIDDGATVNGTEITFDGTGYAVMTPIQAVELLNFGADLNNLWVTLKWKTGQTYQAPATFDVVTTDDGTYNVLAFEMSGVTFDTADFPLPDGTVPGVTDEQHSLAFMHMSAVTAEARGDTGRYKVPFHHGSYVEVDNAPQTLLTAYTVDRHRSAIQFLAGQHPADGAQLAFNLFTSDRMFVAMASPFDYDVSRAYDNENYDILPYDDAGSTLTEADNFLLVVDSAYATNHQPIVFNDSLPGRSKCHLADIEVAGADGEVWIMTAISDYVLSVQRVSPTNSAPQLAYLNQRFDNGSIAFTLSAPWVAYYFDLQTNSYMAAIDVPNGDYATYNWLYDRADFYPNVSIVTEHGVPNDPIPPRHDPVLYNTIGHVKQRLDGSYFLELLTIPPRGTYVEVRVEQSLQYNPRVNTAMGEKLDIVVITDSDIRPQGQLNGQGGQSVVTMITTFVAPTEEPPEPPAPIVDVGDFELPDAQTRITGWMHPTNAFNVPYVVYLPNEGRFITHPGPNAERPLVQWNNTVGPGTYNISVTCQADVQPDSNYYTIVLNGTTILATVNQGQTYTAALNLNWYDYIECQLTGPSYAGGGDYLIFSMTGPDATVYDAQQAFVDNLGEQTPMWKYFYRANTINGQTNSAGPMLPIYGPL